MTKIMEYFHRFAVVFAYGSELCGRVDEAEGGRASRSGRPLRTGWTALRTLTVMGLFAGLACVGSLCVSAPALAAGRADDAAATRVYLRASEAYEGSVAMEVAARVAAMAARANEIAGGCPSALSYAPRDEAFGELGEEASLAVFWAGAPSMRSAGLRLAGVVAHLTWSDRRLTRLVHTQAVEEHAAATIVLPDVCADIAVWRAGSYVTLPQSSMRFLARVRAIESLAFVGFSEASREAVIGRLLRRFEGPAERRAAKYIERVEARIFKQLDAAEVAARARLAAGLGVATL
jgi:hypothetical protein